MTISKKLSDKLFHEAGQGLAVPRLFQGRIEQVE